MSETKVIETLVSGGQATAGPPLGPSLGPLGLNVLAVVKRINDLTSSYAGMKVPVRIEIDINSKEFDVSIGIPTTSALIVRELGISKGSGTPHSEKVGDLSMEQLINIVRQKQDSLLSKNLKGGVKEVLGSCQSMGITILGKEPKLFQQEIDSGFYDEFFKE